jgi:hypothetical protein
MDTHEKIEQTLVNPLKEAITGLDASFPCDDKVSVLAKLLNAYHQAIAIR